VSYTGVVDAVHNLGAQAGESAVDDGGRPGQTVDSAAVIDRLPPTDAGYPQQPHSDTGPLSCRNGHFPQDAQ
jgi:hypothetical protein